MAITRPIRRTAFPTPWRDLEDVSSRLARFLDDGLFSATPTGGMWAPPVNITETKDELVLTAELPGLREEDVSVEVENNILTVSGEKSEERTEGDEERRHHLWERSYGSFRRSFTLPSTVRAENITARFENGVLRVQLPKVAEAKGRKIEISKS